MRSLLVLALVGCRADPPPIDDLAARGAPGLRVIDGARLETATKYLASDALEGRAPGSRGGALAEDYVARQMAAIGLVPAGEHGTWFQTVPLRSAERDDARCKLVVHGPGGDFSFDRDELIYRADVRAADIALETRLVFVGFGIHQPTLGWDDLAGVDLHGAIAVVIGGAPHAIAGTPLVPEVRAVLSDTAAKTRTLRDRGAVAMITMYGPDREALRSWDRVVDNARFPTMGWLDGDAVGSEPVLPIVLMHEPAFDLLLLAAGDDHRAHAVWKQADAGVPARLALQATASLAIRSKLRELSARNVAGMIRGTTDELVVYTAHIDHLGIGEPFGGDAIYNGALDNAIGIAGILEIAHAFAALPPQRRSILFLATTGEEKGLLGSDYFIHHPTVPLDRIVADINIDGLTAQWEPHDIIPIGAEHSSLAGDVRAAARATGLAISVDPEPDQVYFVRSDQYSFVRRGVPAVFPGAGYRDARGATTTNRAISSAWGAAHYHRPSDEWRPEFRAAWAVREVRFDFLLGLAVANDVSRPAWNPGDPLAPGRGLPW